MNLSLPVRVPIATDDCRGLSSNARLATSVHGQVAKSELRQKLLMCSPGLLWLAIMFAKPHKVQPHHEPMRIWNYGQKAFVILTCWS